MKRSWMILFFVAAPLLAQGVSPQELSSLLQKGEHYLLGKESGRIGMSMQVKRPGEQEMGYSLECFFASPDKRLVVFKTPPESRGTAYLRNGPHLYWHNPKVKQTSRIPFSMLHWPLMNSDFRYHDMLWASSLSADYEIKFLGVSQKYPSVLFGTVYMLELIPKESVLFSCPKLHVWLGTRKPYLLEILYFSAENQRNRSCVFRDLRRKGSMILPAEWEMSNLLNAGYTTKLTLWEVQYDQPLPPELFNTEMDIQFILSQMNEENTDSQ